MRCTNFSTGKILAAIVLCRVILYLRNFQYAKKVWNESYVERTTEGQQRLCAEGYFNKVANSNRQCKRHLGSADSLGSVSLFC